MPPPFTTTADAVAREADWLRTSGDGLPALLSDVGGSWDLIQAYAPRSAAQRKNQIWVMRHTLQIERSANVRSIAHYSFELLLLWTLSSKVGSAEADQAAFDTAINDLLLRIMGPLMDKTHGGRFLSVAEDPRTIDVEFTPADKTIGASASFEARVRYRADDWELNN